MYVILTSKPGQFHTEPSDDLAPVETYDYLFYGQKKAEFTIAELRGDTKVRVVDDVDPTKVSEIPSKLLERFETIEGALRELNHLVAFGSMDTALCKR